MADVPTLTPFITDVLTAVRATCGPTAPGWEQALARRLHAEFYAEVRPGDPITAAGRNAEHLRLLAVEKRLAGRPAPAADGGRWHTFDPNPS